MHHAEETIEQLHRESIQWENESVKRGIEKLAIALDDNMHSKKSPTNVKTGMSLSRNLFQ